MASPHIPVHSWFGSPPLSALCLFTDQTTCHLFAHLCTARRTTASPCSTLTSAAVLALYMCRAVGLNPLADWPDNHRAGEAHLCAAAHKRCSSVRPIDPPSPSPDARRRAMQSAPLASDRIAERGRLSGPVQPAPPGPARSDTHARAHAADTTCYYYYYNYYYFYYHYPSELDWNQFTDHSPCPPLSPASSASRRSSQILLSNHPIDPTDRPAD